MNTQHHAGHQRDRAQARNIELQARQSPVPQQARRGLHVSTVATLVLGIPTFIVSLIIVGSLTVFGTWGWIVFISWLLSGGVTLWRPAENVLVRVFSRLRHPTRDERERLAMAWRAVVDSAGITKSKYSLWIQESGETNALAAGGHTVAVTRNALEKLSPKQLEAVMAHELGHHLGGHAWVMQLMYWYSIPGRFTLSLTWPLVQVASWLMKVTSRLLIGTYHFISEVVRSLVPNGVIIMLAVRGIIWTIVWMIIIPMIIVLAATLAVTLAPLALLVLIIAIILAWFNRLGEKYADQVAARLGYGTMLIQVLQDLSKQERDRNLAELGLTARLLSSHPPASGRIRALEHYLERNQMGIHSSRAS